MKKKSFSRLYISQQHKLELLWAKTDKNMKLQSRLEKETSIKKEASLS
jgi:hypothetical protein